MQFTNAILGAALCGMLASSVSAHMVITSPVPFGQSSLTNSPLINDGSDFPCKQRSGVYDITKMNQMPVGVPQSLAFKGGATHGGGSCQVSVTLDKEPTQNSQWKVVHSIVGGCPSNTTGNLSEDADGTGASVFEFSIPKGMPNGQYSLAWTWFNKIGNREMYMNCAPITVSGGADNNDDFNALPNTFVINIPNEQCASVEGEDFVFPSPGDSAETPFKTALGSSTIGSGCATVMAKGAGSGAAGTPAPAAPTSGASSPSGYAAGSASTEATSAAPQMSTSAPAYSQATAGPAGGSAAVTITTMATVTGGAPTAAASSYAPPPANAPAPAAGSGSSSASSPSSNNTTMSSGSCSNGAVSCSKPGCVVCIGSNQFGLCDINNCAVPQALADGTSCSGGVVAKRHMAHGRRHLAGRRSF
ncbi:hypothetical protein LTR48_000766 [Friedmanniomyces endolithicus]|uniref:Chitin-binding type-4 domain-containing protein n=1 Tax=Rachicladosporium monterosium TaxID=1507873 RepID=A0ABR0LEN0_9PEZI|nr:hypothetical protein LTR29_011236 [Friedmanniomyces endolithicus]KAK1094222.1 hypothetical protein LTR48_000766 [Friedmanniomyces endolithicus]KAK5147652.1 hypothetical protein LTR32_000932 [Rachicladosporium monterosium]